MTRSTHKVSRYSRPTTTTTSSDAISKNKNAFKKRAPLGSVTNPKNRREMKRNNNKSNPFTSYNPNKSGFIVKDAFKQQDTDADADFSRFLNNDIAQNQETVNNETSNDATNDNYNNSNSSSNDWPKKQNIVNDQLDVTIDQFLSMDHFSGDSTNNKKSQKSNKNNNNLKPHNSKNNKNNENTEQPFQNGRKKQNRFNLNYIPMDWSLKSQMYLISDSPFLWCSQIPLNIENCAFTGAEIPPANSSELSRKQYTFHSSLKYYKFPHDKCGVNELSSIHSYYLKNSNSLQRLQKIKIDHYCSENQESDGVDFGALSSQLYLRNHGSKNDAVDYNTFVDRIIEWIDSLKCLFNLFRSGFCKSFYIHFPSFFNIVYCISDDGSGGSSASVIITNTHQSFRNNLKKENIPFSTPLIGNSKNVSGGCCDDGSDGSDGDDAMDVTEIQRNGIVLRKASKKRGEKGFAAGYNNNERTVTLIQGMENIESFSDFFMNYIDKLCLSIKKCHDVPLIVCNKIFLNSKCCLLKMSKNQSGLNQENETMHIMQLNGFILPETNHEIIKLLVSNKQSAQVSYKIHEKMYDGLNYCAKSELFTTNATKGWDAIHKIVIDANLKSVVAYLK